LPPAKMKDWAQRKENTCILKALIVPTSTCSFQVPK